MKWIVHILAIVAFYNCSSPSLGYQDKISYLPSDNIEVYLDGNNSKKVEIPLYDVNGNEVDKVDTLVFEQPEVDTSSWYKIGFQYKKTFDYLPKKLESGIYYFNNSSPFIVKNPSKKNDVLVVYPSNTVNAYNDFGGRSGYGFNRAASLSYRRPRGIAIFSANFYKWLPSQGFGVDYICDKDLDEYENIENYRVIIIPGHNEYWTRKARRNFDRFIDKGGDAIILSGNTMWWQVRYEKDNMIIYRNYALDSLVPDSLKTIKWVDKRLKYPVIKSIGADFDNGGYGLEEDTGWDGYLITNSSILFEGTGIKKGDILHIPTLEYDGIPLKFTNELPEIDTSKVNFFRQVLLGYDKGYRRKETYGTFIIFQKTKQSGIIINTASTNWCLEGFTGKDGEKIKKLTYNFIDFLLSDKSVF